MKKFFLILSVLAFSSVLSAATFTWGGVAYTNETDFSLAQGSVWLIALGSGTSTEGISVATGGALTLGSGMSVFAEARHGAANFDNTMPGFTSANLGNYVVVVYDEVTNRYGISQVESIVASDFQGGSVDEDIAAGSKEFSNREDSEGRYLLTDMDVVAIPEPTVMALLALGVAGLALRRKVA